MKCSDIKKIVYRGRYFKHKIIKTSIRVIGCDTEADRKGRCFMISTSLGDIFRPAQFPACFFTRKYRNKNFVCYNLKYDEGALLQVLSIEQLQELRLKGKVKYGEYSFKSIPQKCLTVKRGRNCVNFYDIYRFYENSLDFNAKKYLHKTKIDLNPKKFTAPFIKSNQRRIARYCIKDAQLTQELAELMIKTYEGFGIYPRKLYSTAYISFQYFSQTCHYNDVRDLWRDRPRVLDLALRSYAGGKFEVTRKGADYYYEYDIISAYPFEIANLIDLRFAHYNRSKKYQRQATYGFIECNIQIPLETFSPVPIKWGTVNCYPVGELHCVITKAEYDFLVENGCDVTIINAEWVFMDNIVYPYRREINRLVELKQQYKDDKTSIKYHTCKILLNSFYGKMVQLYLQGEKFIAGTSWNPIHAAIITANTRIKVSQLQQQFPSIVAVHTDSVISTTPLDLGGDHELGDFDLECEGDGAIVGSGIYFIGDKIKFRGFRAKGSMRKMLKSPTPSFSISVKQAYTWKEVAFRGLDVEYINRFEQIPKEVNVNFDHKRLWINDYKKFSDIQKRRVESMPHSGINGILF